MILEHRTITMFVLNYLREEILDGKLEPGMVVDQNELAKKIEVSRTPVRLALQQLESQGLIIMHPHHSAIVAPLTVEEAEGLYAMRYGLEEIAGFLGAEKMNDSCLMEMCKCFDKMTQLGKIDSIEMLDEFLEIDTKFHQVHYLASGKMHLIKQISRLRELCKRYTKRCWALPKGISSTLESHEKILNACRNHDGKSAARYIRMNLENTVKDITDYIRQLKAEQ